MEDAEVGVVDLAARAQVSSEHGVLWTCQSTDLNLNLLAVLANTPMPEHVNNDVDVLVVGVEGEGSVVINGNVYAVQRGQAIVIPKGVRRSIRCDHGRFVYLTCHRRRAGLWPQELRRRNASGSHGRPDATS